MTGFFYSHCPFMNLWKFKLGEVHHGACKDFSNTWPFSAQLGRGKGTREASKVLSFLIIFSNLSLINFPHQYNCTWARFCISQTEISMKHSIWKRWKIHQYINTAFLQKGIVWCKIIYIICSLHGDQKMKHFVCENILIQNKNCNWWTCVLNMLQTGLYHLELLTIWLNAKFLVLSSLILLESVLYIIYFEFMTNITIYFLQNKNKILPDKST